MKKLLLKTEKKTNKGITLIALVITIIVLLILAGVSVSVLTSDNGLITKAGEAKNANTEAEGLERIKLAVIASYNNRGILDTIKLAQNLKEIGGIKYSNNSDITNDIKLPQILKLNEVYYSIKEDGETNKYIDPFNYGEGKTKTTVQPGNEITITKDTITESFTVISNTNGKILALPKYNITLTTDHPVQSSSAGGTKFATRPYWSTDETNNEISGWNSEAVNNSIDIDMNNSANIIQKYITAYETTLKDMGAEGITVRAAKKSELEVTGVVDIVRNVSLTGTFWLGSVKCDTNVHVWTCEGTSWIDFQYYSYGYGPGRGVRPIIIID